MPRPLSMSSDGTPNHSSLRSAATAGGESDELELELSNSSNSHSQAASARSRRVTSVGSISIDEPDEDATIPDVGRPHQRFLKSRFSMSAASATETTSDARRVSIFAPSTVTATIMETSAPPTKRLLQSDDEAERNASPRPLTKKRTGKAVLCNKIACFFPQHKIFVHSDCCPSLIGELLKLYFYGIWIGSTTQ